MRPSRVVAAIAAGLFTTCAPVLVATKGASIPARATMARAAPEGAGRMRLLLVATAGHSPSQDAAELLFSCVVSCTAGVQPAQDVRLVYEVPIAHWQEQPRFLTGRVDVQECGPSGVVAGGSFDFEPAAFVAKDPLFLLSGAQAPGIRRLDLAPTTFALGDLGPSFADGGFRAEQPREYPQLGQDAGVTPD